MTEGLMLICTHTHVHTGSGRLTVGGVFDPAEGDGAVSITLTEAQQESSRSFITEQGLSALLSHKSHNAPVTQRIHTRKTLSDKREQETTSI